MTLADFKAWFEGFTENMDGAPNAEQWKRIRKKVKEIDGEWTPRHIFIDRYVRPYRAWWSDGIYCGHRLVWGGAERRWRMADGRNCRVSADGRPRLTASPCFDSMPYQCFVRVVLLTEGGTM